MTDTAIKFHPLADMFPLMEGAEFDALVADIKANGLHEDIVFYENMILDGRNRYRAWLAAGKDPAAIPSFDGDSLIDEIYGGPVAYVISKNIRRRHLTAEQKRELIAKLIKAQPEKSNRQIAGTAKASPTTVGAVRAKMEAKGDVSNLDTSTDTKGRKQPRRRRATKGERRRKAREYRSRRELERHEEARKDFEAEIAAAQAEAEQIAVDLVKLNRNLAQRLHAHLGEGMWLKDALARRLGLDDDDSTAVDAEASAEAMKAEFAADDGLDIRKRLRRDLPPKEAAA
jgi:hypothetical protein